MTLFNLIPSLANSLSHPARAREEGSNSEQHRSLRPQYDIRETPDAWALTVQLPGVTKDELEITVDESQVRVFGRRGWKPAKEWSCLYRESADADFELVLNHENAIDADKIHAELKDGVLRASLPKAAAIKPRKVAVN